MKIFHSLFFIGLLLAALPAMAQQKSVQLKARKTVIYELPSTASRQIAQLSKGTKVKLLQSNGDWVQLAFGRNRIGWMQVAFEGRAGAAVAENDSRQPAPAAQVVDSPGGLSFHLGFFGGDFTYLMKFYYRNRPRWHFEGSFQYVADRVLSIYVMDASFKYLWRIDDNYVSWFNTGVGVLTNVPVKSVGAKSISNMAFNYGIGIQKPLKQSTHARFDLRQMLVLSNNGISSFLEFSAGLVIDIGQN